MHLSAPLPAPGRGVIIVKHMHSIRCYFLIPEVRAALDSLLNSWVLTTVSTYVLLLRFTLELFIMILMLLQ